MSGPSAKERKKAREYWSDDLIPAPQIGEFGLSLLDALAADEAQAEVDRTEIQAYSE
ncbi:hypothetical protein LCGC14_2936750, partial [marine sediment metagenome]